MYRQHLMYQKHVRVLDFFELSNNSQFIIEFNLSSSFSSFSGPYHRGGLLFANQNGRFFQKMTPFPKKCYGKSLILVTVLIDFDGIVKMQMKISIILIKFRRFYD